MKKWRENRAATMTDVIVGMIILIMFTGILTTSFYKMYMHNISIRMNAIAVDYAIKILEDVDRMTYEEVTNDLNNTLTQKYTIKENYTINLEIENYNKNDETKQDIIKTVKVTVKFKVADQEQEYTVKKVKIKEM